MSTIRTTALGASVLAGFVANVIAIAGNRVKIVYVTKDSFFLI